ncbi:MAG: hypothetical protein ABI690_16895 [Chloroflexota bacterium]
MNASSPIHTLPEIFGFTQNDVVANREGHLGANQQKRLRQGRRLWLIGMVTALGCWVVVLFNSQELSEVVVVLRVGCILAALILGYKAYQMHRDLMDNHVSVFSGEIKLVVKTGKGLLGQKHDPMYFLKMDAHTFKVTHQEYDMLVDGANYTIFYLARSWVILSVVPS